MIKIHPHPAQPPLLLVGCTPKVAATNHRHPEYPDLVHELAIIKHAALCATPEPTPNRF